MYALLRSDYFELNTLSPKSSGLPVKFSEDPEWRAL